jgi:hypothetical protein
MELEPLPNPIPRGFLNREQSEHRSESIYFTPTGTPVREVFGSWANGVQSNSLKNTPAKEIDPYKAVYVAGMTGLGKKPVQGHRRNKSWSQFLPPLSLWLSTNNREASRINEVEVVIEHETNGDDYYVGIGPDGSPTASKVSDAVAESMSKSTTGGSIRRSFSVPGDEASGKRSLTSSSGIVSMVSSSSPQQQQLNSDKSEEEVPLLQRSALAKSVTCLFPESDPLQQKRLSI